MDQYGKNYLSVEKQGRVHYGGLRGYKTICWVKISLFEWFIKILPIFK